MWWQRNAFRCSFASPRSFEDNLREHKVFDKIEEAKPLTIEQGGQQAVFGAAQCTKALSQENNKCKCSGNFFWQDLPWLPNHRVSTDAGQINQIQIYDLPPTEPPKFFPYIVIVAVESANEIKPDGGWPRLSPAEPVFALLLSVQECIQAGEMMICWSVGNSCLWQFLSSLKLYQLERKDTGEPASFEKALPRRWSGWVSRKAERAARHQAGATKPQKVTETPCCTSCEKNQPATAHSSCADAAAVKTAAPNTTDSPKPEGKTCVGQSLGR